MTKDKFLEDFKNLFQDKNVEVNKMVEGSMDKEADIAKCSFPGVYVILQNDNVIYIGSAYAGKRSIADRLKQYLSNSKTGNTLANAFIRNRDIDADDDKKANKVRGDVIQEIRACSFMAFQYKDLEYELIKGCDNLINYAGNKKN
ncbi:MAG: GIY-YIG nuclease family protein [Clostridia bacterium]|nr:GIY-YIG nuclease family protein [Clostridia bacterium]